MRHSTIILALFILTTAQAKAGSWKKQVCPCMTSWGKNLSPEKVHPEYPRPMLERKEWMNLNGIWEFEEATKGLAAPFNKTLKEEILVPFPWESALSGIQRNLSTQSAWYRRTFTVPNTWNGKNILLNFGAVDWETEVYINGKFVGNHKGGYDAFSFDITPYLQKKGKQELVICVTDPTDKANIARGKQSSDRFNDPEGCFYRSNSGIWQTVWMEPVSKNHISSIQTKCTEKLDGFMVEVVPSSENCDIEVNVKTDGQVVASAKRRTMNTLKLKVRDARLWTPETPFLYDIEVKIIKDGKVTDQISSYAGMRCITIEKFNDIPRICLNHQPIYQHGPLDQGYWPDGIYTAPSHEALVWDIKNIKAFGFNMIRKHIKVEPQTWYHACDKLGVLVWQDMPNGGGIFDDEAKLQTESELRRMIQQHSNNPCIIVWTIFNEHWGLFDVERLTDNTKKMDPSRLVMANSGIDARDPHIDYELGDIKDNHSYLPPNLPLVSSKRVTVNGEYGALGYYIPEHSWSTNGKYMHDYYKDKTDKKTAATDQYIEFMNSIHTYIGKGLSASVYTQWTDVENEINGLYTYDREVIKLDKERVKAANEACYQIFKDCVKTEQ